MNIFRATQTLFYAFIGIVIMIIIILPLEWLAWMITGRNQNIAGRFTRNYQSFLGARQ